MFHRVWECQHPDAVSTRAVFASATLVQRAIDAGGEHPLFSRGIGVIKLRADFASNDQRLEFRRNGTLIGDRSL